MQHDRIALVAKGVRRKNVRYGEHDLLSHAAVVHPGKVLARAPADDARNPVDLWFAAGWLDPQKARGPSLLEHDRVSLKLPARAIERRAYLVRGAVARHAVHGRALPCREDVSVTGPTGRRAGVIAAIDVAQHIACGGRGRGLLGQVGGLFTNVAVPATDTPPTPANPHAVPTTRPTRTTPTHH